jgi:hypothetical protein
VGEEGRFKEMEKEKTYSGYYIHWEMDRLKLEMNEFEEAMNEVDANSLAFKLLKIEKEKRFTEWDKLQKTKFIVFE